MDSIEEYSVVFASTGESRSEVDLEALVDVYSPLLFRVAYAVLRNRTEAEDAVQDAFVRILKHRPALPAVRNMQAWLVRIVWNIAMDHRKRVQPEQMDREFADSLAAKHPSVDNAFSEARQVRDVLNEIDRLPKRERQVLLLSALEELSSAEIAKVVERSEAAVRAMLFRSRARLRERLGRRA